MYMILLYAAKHLYNILYSYSSEFYMVWSCRLFEIKYLNNKPFSGNHSYSTKCLFLCYLFSTPKSNWESLGIADIIISLPDCLLLIAYYSEYFLSLHEFPFWVWDATCGILYWSNCFFQLFQSLGSVRNPTQSAVLPAREITWFTPRCWLPPRPGLYNLICIVSRIFHVEWYDAMLATVRFVLHFVILHSYTFSSP